MPFMRYNMSNNVFINGPLQDFSTKERTRTMKYDVIVAGAGPAGFAAAIGAAQAGKKVLLLDKNAGPGGVAVYCGCPVFAGMFGSHGELPPGVAGEFASRMKGRYFVSALTHLNSSEFEVGLCMTRMLREAGVEMLFYAMLTAAECREGRIRSVTVSGCGNTLRLEAESFVDATGDAVLSRLAGAELLPSDPDETMTKTVLFRVSHVKNFDKPKLCELFPSLDFPYPHQDRFMGTIVGEDEANGDVLLNLTAVSGNALDLADLTRMDIELREQIPVILDWMRKKLPGFEECRLSAVAPQIGVRGSCNVKGRAVITAADLDNDTPVDEPVAMGKRSYGGHYLHQFRSPWGTGSSGYRAIPYGALRPAGLDNLSVGGRCISIESKAVSAVRLMPVCMATGQAAGIAAALDFPPYPVLKQELIRQGIQV